MRTNPERARLWTFTIEYPPLGGSERPARGGPKCVQLRLRYVEPYGAKFIISQALCLTDHYLKFADRPNRLALSGNAAFRREQRDAGPTYLLPGICAENLIPGTAPR